jgi:hypothetical protein
MEIRLGKRLGRTAEMLAAVETTLAQSITGQASVHIDTKTKVTAVKGLDGITVIVKTADGTWRTKAASLDQGLEHIIKVQDAVATIVERGRTYRTQAGGISLHVWDKNVAVLKNVKEVFGGNYYRHKSGLVWMCSNRRVLKDVWVTTAPYLDNGSRERLALLEVFSENAV